MHEPTVYRRDWFRLRRGKNEPKSESLIISRESACESPSHGLKIGPHGHSAPLAQVPAPPNHHEMDLSELPPMSEAILDVAQLDSLIEDICALASNISLIHKGSFGEQSQPPESSAASQLEVAKHLETAGFWLKAGQIQRLQIRYVWEDAKWIDTLERNSNGFRLVRICHKTGAV